MHTGIPLNDFLCQPWNDAWVWQLLFVLLSQVREVPSQLSDMRIQIFPTPEYRGLPSIEYRDNTTPQESIMTWVLLDLHVVFASQETPIDLWWTTLQYMYPVELDREGPSRAKWMRFRRYSSWHHLLKQWKHLVGTCPWFSTRASPRRLLLERWIDHVIQETTVVVHPLQVWSHSFRFMYQKNRFKFWKLLLHAWKWEWNVKIKERYAHLFPGEVLHQWKGFSLETSFSHVYQWYHNTFLPTTTVMSVRQTLWKQVLHVFRIPFCPQQWDHLEAYLQDRQEEFNETLRRRWAYMKPLTSTITLFHFLYCFLWMNGLWVTLKQGMSSSLCQRPVEWYGLTLWYQGVQQQCFPHPPESVSLPMKVSMVDETCPPKYVVECLYSPKDHPCCRTVRIADSEDKA